MEPIVDQSFEYSAGHGHRTPEQSRAVRKKILLVTALLSVITIVEVLVGIYFSKTHVSPGTWTLIKWFYIIMTLVKAGYIVLVFMHLAINLLLLLSINFKRNISRIFLILI